MSTRRPYADARALIMHFEGCRIAPYLDPVGIWTVGYGHVLHDAHGRVLRGPTMQPIVDAIYPLAHRTREHAERLLVRDIRTVATGVRTACGPVPLRPHQRGALISFAFNVGLAALHRSTLLRRVHAGAYDAVPDELRRWNRAGGKILPGLVRRREAEARLWQGLPWQEGT